jgi:hypothetical protein
LLSLTFRYAFQISVFGISNGFLADFEAYSHGE